jgi:aryl-alcohol dehydrogenase-like predicted oxidoreductase
MSLKNKLALGTVQFGLDYGINNSNGKIDTFNAHSILDFAFKNGVDVLDTASAYGASEGVIGQYNDSGKFKIVSKIPAEFNSIQEEFEKTLNELKVDSLYGYMYHDFNSFMQNQGSYMELCKLKSQKKIEKIGFSVYYPSQIEFLIVNDIQFDIVQIPYSIFDRRFETIFPLLKDMGIEIHVRSVFLQGLFFKDINTLEPIFIKVRNELLDMRNISDSNELEIASLCLNYCLLNKFIDKVVIGVDSLANLKMNIELLSDFNEVEKIKHRLDVLRVDDEQILLPFNWRL